MPRERHKLPWIADMLGIGTLWGAVAHAIIAFFIIPIAVGIAEQTPGLINQATRENAAALVFRCLHVLTLCLVLLDVVGWAIRTGQLKIHVGGTKQATAVVAPPHRRPPNATAATSYGVDDADRVALDVLGLQDRATTDEIKAAWRQAAKIHHPDNNPHDVKGAQDRFDSAKAAYTRLTTDR